MAIIVCASIYIECSLMHKAGAINQTTFIIVTIEMIYF